MHAEPSSALQTPVVTPLPVTHVKPVAQAAVLLAVSHAKLAWIGVLHLAVAPDPTQLLPAAHSVVDPAVHNSPLLIKQVPVPADPHAEVVRHSLLAVHDCPLVFLQTFVESHLRFVPHS